MPVKVQVTCPVELARMRAFANIPRFCLNLVDVEEDGGDGVDGNALTDKRGMRKHTMRFWEVV